ncbi:MAG: ATP-binding cassette domain-containing protein [Thermoplasmata archaeon]
MSDTSDAKDGIIVLKDVKKEYRVKGRSVPVPALRGVNLRIPSGAMVAIKGASGSGKTTLLQMIGALDIPTSGSVKVNGKELSKMDEKYLTEYRAKTLGFVFQSFNLLPDLTVIENVELPMEALNVPKQERRKKSLKLLTAVGMIDRSDYKPLKISGGEQQRVAIARALANNPTIILADEPTGNLDSITGAKIIRLMDDIRKNRGTTVVIVTHSNSVARMCENVITIRDGKITSEQDLREVEDDESERRTLKANLSLSGKVANRLFEAGYDTLEKLEEATPEELTKILGDSNKAKKIVRKVEMLKELRDEKIE